MGVAQIQSVGESIVEMGTAAEAVESAELQAIAPMRARTAHLRAVPQPLATPRPTFSEVTWPLLKRTIDVAVSAVALLLLLPLIVVISILIRLDSPGPVFFQCDRVGKDRERLRMLKFRKMRNDATGLALTVGDDERFTRIGRLLARYKIDELPQFWHVLTGEMSLVGPRPESEVFVSCFASEYDSILKVRPGIVGLSQLAFAEESRVLDPHDPTRHYVQQILPQKVRMDLLYVDRLRFVLDMRILMWSALALLARREVAVHRGTGRLGLRRRPQQVRSDALELDPSPSD